MDGVFSCKSALSLSKCMNLHSHIAAGEICFPLFHHLLTNRCQIALEGVITDTFVHMV